MKIKKKELKGNSCYLCGKFGHFELEHLKRKNWFEKKGELNAYVCFESSLHEISHNTWWIDSRCMTYVSDMM